MGQRDTATIVVAEGVERRFGPVEVLRGVDLRVESGEWVALMGPSGCGKSTLLHVLSGLDEIDAGHVFIDGSPMQGVSASARAKLRREAVGLVFQQGNLLAHLDGTSNVELAGRIAGLSRRTAASRAAALMDRLGVADLARAAPATMSGGQQQRVAIARALVHEPRVLFADEPTGALDSVATAAVIDLFRTLHEGGQTIVMVTHDREVATAADRVVSFLDGRVVGEGAKTLHSAGAQRE